MPDNTTDTTQQGLAPVAPPMPAAQPAPVAPPMPTVPIQPTVPATPPIESPEAPKKSNIGLILAIVLLVLTLLGAAGYYVYSNYLGPKPQVQYTPVPTTYTAPTVAPTESSSPSASPTQAPMVSPSPSASPLTY